MDQWLESTIRPARASAGHSVGVAAETARQRENLTHRMNDDMALRMRDREQLEQQASERDEQIDQNVPETEPPDVDDINLEPPPSNLALPSNLTRYSTSHSTSTGRSVSVAPSSTSDALTQASNSLATAFGQFGKDICAGLAIEDDRVDDLARRMDRIEESQKRQVEMAVANNEVLNRVLAMVEKIRGSESGGNAIG
jgi:hypothetical protein